MPNLKRNFWPGVLWGLWILWLSGQWGGGVGAQDFAQLLQRGPAPYLQGPALRLYQGPLTAGDGADIAVRDYDGDGWPDVLVGSAYGDLLLYRRLPTGIYAAPQPLTSAQFSFLRPQDSRRQISPELADINNDGALELLLGAGGELFVYRRRGEEWLPGQPLATAAGHTMGQSIQSAHIAPCAQDVDGDGDTDILLGDEEGRVWWAACLEAETLRFAEPVLLAAGGQMLRVGRRARVCVGDWDGDGRYDLIVGDMTGQAYFVRGRREGFAAPQALFSASACDDTGTPLTHLCPRLVHVRADERPELLLGCQAGFVAIFEATAAQGLRCVGTLQAQAVPLDVGRYAAPTACDWNKDGVPDIISGAEDGRVRLFLGRPDGFFESGQLLASTEGPLVARPAEAVLFRYSWPRVADMNRDGVPDLALGGASGTIEIYLNQGGLRPAGRLRLGGMEIRAQGLSALALADYDGDGDTDVFVGDMPLPGQASFVSALAGPQYVLPTGGLTYYENEAPKGQGMPVFLKGVRLAAYIGSRERAVAEEALDAAVLGLHYVEPLPRSPGNWSFLVGTQAGYYVFQNFKGPELYPLLLLPTKSNWPPPFLPPLYSCTAAILSPATEKLAYREKSLPAGRNSAVNQYSARGLLCGLAEYGFVCYFPAEQVPQINARNSSAP